MEIDWQLIITIASILTALGVIYGSARKWGGAISKAIAKTGWKNLSARDLEDNAAWAQHQAESKATLDALNALADKMDLIHKDLSTSLAENTKITLKLELKELFRNHPERIDAIESTYKAYRDLHGNTYIKDMYEAWEEKYLNKVAEKEVNKGGK